MDERLNQQQKIKILRRWEYDARELEVAEEENMKSNDVSLLGDILVVLHKLGIKVDREKYSPTKQGGTE